MTKYIIINSELSDADKKKLRELFEPIGPPKLVMASYPQGDVYTEPFDDNYVESKELIKLFNKEK
tara:strand:- start:32946 stop:33140 length:195 start_codon:yes stop_codon:yes gene_type:complete